jgi:hypothetical protein
MGMVPETANVDHRLSTKENKLQFTVSVCSKQMEVFRSVFRLQQTNGSCHFPLVPFSARTYTIHKHVIYVEMYMKIDMNMKMDMDMDENLDEDMETWTRTLNHGQGHGNMDKDMDTRKRKWKHGRGHGNMDEEMKT